MKETPILYSTLMIQAKLDGRKTQTRRLKGLESVNSHIGKLLKLIGDSRTCDHPHPAIKYDDRIWFWFSEGMATFDAFYAVRCPYKPGDILWARETFFQAPFGKVHYRADITKEREEVRLKNLQAGHAWAKWKPSIFQPKGLARIWERITDIRVERLQDISEEDAIAEGIQPLLASGAQLATQGRLYKHYTEYQEGLFGTGLSPVKSYQTLWESINGPGSWDLNPWCWCITSEILSTTGRQNAGLAVSKTETK